MDARNEELRQCARSVGAFPTARPETYRRVLFDHRASKWDHAHHECEAATPPPLDFRQQTVRLLWSGRDSARAGDLTTALVAFETAERFAVAVDDKRLQALAVVELVATWHALGLLTRDAPVRARAHSALPVLHRDYPRTAKRLEALLGEDA